MSQSTSIDKDKCKVVLITGGSRGIGRSIVKEFAQDSIVKNQRTHIIINYSNSESPAKETLNIIGELNPNILSASLLKFDVSDSDQISKAFKEVRSNFGGLDVLVNNAGITLNQLALRTKYEDWQRVIDINLSGTFLCSKAALKLLLKSNFGGRIVNVSSVVAQMGNPGQIAYVASKAGIEGLTRSLAKELGTRKITINAVAPGFIKTDMTDELDEEQTSAYLQNIPLGRFGAPDEVASLCVFLASREAGYITGQVIQVNGGLYL